MSNPHLRTPGEFGPKPFYSDDLCPLLQEMLSQGKTPLQVCRHLHISKRMLEDWLSSPDPKYDALRDAYEIGMTGCEAYWEEQGQTAILGKIRDFKESTYKLFMANRFKWNEKSEITQTIKTPEQLMSDEAIDAKLKEYEQTKNDRPDETTSPKVTH